MSTLEQISSAGASQAAFHAAQAASAQGWQAARTASADVQDLQPPPVVDASSETRRRDSSDAEQTGASSANSTTIANRRTGPGSTLDILA